MKVAGVLTRAVQSVPVIAIVCVVAVPLILLRLFGVLFFASTTSMWATVPALTLGSLLFISSRPVARRGIIAIGLIAAYLCSVLFYGWADMKLRLDEGQSNWLDILEAALISVLVARCFTAETEPR